MQTTAHSTSRPTRVSLRFIPTLASISSTGHFIKAFYEPLVRDASAAARAALAAHELMENALKYSIDGQTCMTVELVRLGGECTITIQTSHFISAERREALEEVFVEMDRATSAAEYYELKIRRRQARPHGSGLGLARLWAEGEMHIEHAFDGARVRISAATTVMEEESEGEPAKDTVSAIGFG
jgi:two-component sensor histidine kinase